MGNEESSYLEPFSDSVGHRPLDNDNAVIKDPRVLECHTRFFLSPFSRLTHVGQPGTLKNGIPFLVPAFS